LDLIKIKPEEIRKEGRSVLEKSIQYVLKCL